MPKKLLDKISSTHVVIGLIMVVAGAVWFARDYVDKVHSEFALADDLKKQGQRFQQKLDVFSRSALRVQMADWTRELGELAVIEKKGELTSRDIKRLVELENLLKNAREDLKLR